MCGATVLCIDDLAHQLAIRKASLESRGYSVQTASSGRAALRILEQMPVSAILLEYKREGMDAAAIAFLIKQRFPQLPILLLSAYELPEQVLWLFDDYVLKGAITVSSLINDYYGISDVCLSLPTVVNRFPGGVAARAATSRSGDAAEITGRVESEHCRT